MGIIPIKQINTLIIDTFPSIIASHEHFYPPNTLYTIFITIETQTKYLHAAPQYN